MLLVLLVLHVILVLLGPCNPCDPCAPAGFSNTGTGGLESGVGVGEVGDGGLGSEWLGRGRGVGVGGVVVFTSNSPRVKSSGAFGANEHFGQMGRVWDKWACGDWDK